MLSGKNRITLNQETMRMALEYFLNTKVLTSPVKVGEIEYRTESPSSVGAMVYHVHITPTDPADPSSPPASQEVGVEEGDPSEETPLKPRKRSSW